MVGKDGQTHTVECEATSLFSAAEKAMAEWTRLWWFTSDALLEIKSGGDQWRVSQARVMDRRSNWPISRASDDGAGE